jgi:uncharacterized protein YcgI (DUF1989 family)
MNSDQRYKIIDSFRLEPHTGLVLEIQKRQVLRVITVEGGQVVDLVGYSKEDPQEYLSSPRTMDLNNRIYFSTGDVLYSDQSNPMWTIMEDKVGQHCFIFAPCDQKMFEITYGVTDAHPNCFDNLSNNLAQFGIQSGQIFVPFNIFMNARIHNNGEISIQPPRSKSGDFIDLKAETDMIVGLSACSAYKANDNSFSSIQLEIFSK